MTELIEIKDAPQLLPQLKALLEEYGDYMYDQLKLIAGKNSFFMELGQLPGTPYMPPQGTFIVARYEGQVAGCVGIKKFTDGECEIKRMYIRPLYRKKGIGKLLSAYAIDWSRKAGYHKILLDTNQEMKEAVALYYRSGFTQIAPYCNNENSHPVFMEYIL